MSSSDRHLVELHNVEMKSSRGESIFRDLNLTIEAGATALVAGSSGTGKTSLLDLIIGRRFPDSGSVEVFGKVLRKRRKRHLRAVRRRIGGIGGRFELVPSMTVSDNILLPLVISGERRAIQRELLHQILAELSLTSLAGDYPHELTRVQYTLAQVARATVANQPLILIDEPAAGLDQGTLARVFEYLFKMAVSGRAMLIVCSELPVHKLPGAREYRLSEGMLI
ncbi:MAG: ATP-binding cassette domain-containing protein [candidate division Zixibacteria bacterium]|nr:ATP-binding cassette domain-containing protein [candidate division Zixibacteria bacterium]